MTQIIRIPQVPVISQNSLNVMSQIYLQICYNRQDVREKR